MSDLSIPLTRTALPPPTGRPRAASTAPRPARRRAPRRRVAPAPCASKASARPTARGAGEVRALGGIDAEVAEGSIFGIIGRSGAGKSSLLRLVNRLETPTEGRVLIDGEDIAARRRRARGLPPAGRHGVPALQPSVGQDGLAERRPAARGRRTPRREIERRVAEVLALVGLEGKETSYPSRLSAGRSSASASRGRSCRAPKSFCATRRPRRSTRDHASDPGAPQGHQPPSRSDDRAHHPRDERHPRHLRPGAGARSRRGGRDGRGLAGLRPAAACRDRALLEPLARDLPDDLAARLSPEPQGRDEAVVELRYGGAASPTWRRWPPIFPTACAFSTPRWTASAATARVGSSSPRDSAQRHPAPRARRRGREGSRLCLTR